MKIPHERGAADENRDAVRVREPERDGEPALVADVGPVAAGAAVDIVEGTAIVVDGDRQIEVDLPADADAEDVSLNNGVLTVDA